MAVTNFTVPPTSLDNAQKHIRLLAQAIQGTLLGRTNNIIDATMTADAAATTITDSRIGVHTVAVAIPTTAVNGSMSLVHTNNSQTDKTYKLILIG